MTVLSADFEAGVNGNNITTGDTGSATAWNDVTVGTSCTATYSNTHAHGGSLAAKLLTGATGDQSRLGWTTAMAAATSTGFYFRWYVYMTANPTAAYDHARIETAIGRAMNLSFNIDRTIDIRGDGVVIATTTTPLVLNAWNRIECHLVTGASGTVEVKLFTGANADSISPDETKGPFTTSAALGDITKFYVANGWGSGGGNSNQSIWLDDIKLDTAAYPGPSVAPSASHYVIVAATETDVASVLDIDLPTLGNASGSAGPDHLVAQQILVAGESATNGYFATSGGTITKITAKLQGPPAGTSQVRAVVYQQTGSGPGTLLCYTDQKTFTSVQAEAEYDFTGIHGSAAIVAGSRYWIGLVEVSATGGSSDTGAIRFPYLAGPSGIARYASAVTDPPPSTFPIATSSVAQMWAYISYTPDVIPHSVTLTPADETDTALDVTAGVVGVPRIAAAGLVYLFGDAGVSTLNLTPAAETDSAVALELGSPLGWGGPWGGPWGAVALTLTAVTETDTAVPLGLLARHVLSPASETDSAVALSITHTSPAVEIPDSLALPLGYREAPDLYGRVAVCDLPSGYWRLDDVSYLEDTVGHATLTAVGAPAQDVGLIAYGTSRSLAGTDAFTTTAATSNALGDSFTLECWFTPSSVSGDQTLFSKGTNGYQLQMDASGLNLLKEEDGIIISSTGFTPGIDTPYHIVATKDGPDGAALYVNGADVSDTLTDRTCTDTLLDLSIGRKSDDTEYVTGVLDEVAIYPYPMTADMVAMHYAAGQGDFGSRLFDSDAFPAMQVEIAFDSPWNDPYPRWETITDDLRGAGVTINGSGRPDETQRSSPSAAQMTLNNLAGDFDPTDTAGPYGDRVIPDRPIRFRFAWDTMYWGFQGWVDEWTVDDPSQGYDSITQIACVDMFQSFANFEFDSPNVLFPEQLAGPRIEACLDLLNIPANMRTVDAGLSVMPLLERPTGKILDHVLAVAESDGGFLYVGPDGRIVYEQRDDRVDMPIFGIFGDARDGVEIPYMSLPRSSSTAYLYNRAVVTPSDGNEAAVAEDAESLSEHPPLTYTKSVLTGFNEAQAAAEWYVARYKDPATRFLSVDLTANADPALNDEQWRTILSTVNSMRYTFRRRRLGGGMMELDEYVERIAHKISLSGWVVTWSLSPFGDEDLWPLDDANFILGSNTYPTW